MSLNKEDILERVAEAGDSSPSTARRGFIGGTLATLGLGGIGSVSAGSEPSVVDDKRRLEQTAQPLLDRLAGDGLLEAADTDVLPESEMTLASTTGAMVVESESGPQRVFVTETERGKLEVNLGGIAMEPYAVHRPESGGSQIYLPDGDGGYESQAFGSPTTNGISTDQIAECDGCDCYQRNNCILESQVTICASIEDGECITLSDCGCRI
jgi:hypothetical protein